MTRLLTLCHHPLESSTYTSLGGGEVGLSLPPSHIRTLYFLGLKFFLEVQ
jgi:hypothetical protein